jgi:hypothetical protein
MGRKVRKRNYNALLTTIPTIPAVNRTVPAPFHISSVRFSYPNLQKLLQSNLLQTPKEIALPLPESLPSLLLPRLSISGTGAPLLSPSLSPVASSNPARFCLLLFIFFSFYCLLEYSESEWSQRRHERVLL